jgi:transcriptional regulator with XRE-family HTH domain
MLRLKEARTKKGLTQQQLAQRTGLSQSVISRIEGGKRSPTVRMVEILAKAMRVSARRLME